MKHFRLENETSDTLSHATVVVGAREGVMNAFIKQLGVASEDTVSLNGMTDNGIQDVHSFAQHAMLSPQLGEIRLGVLMQAEKLTPQAQNALLKLLEEPPQRLRLILFVAQETALLPTLLSRCRRYYVNPEVKNEKTTATTTPLEAFSAAESLAKDESLEVEMVARLTAAYKAWQRAGRPQGKVGELDQLLTLILELRTPTNKRLLLEEFVLSSL